MQHELAKGVHVVDYEIDTMGAPFRVILANGVTMTNAGTAEAQVNVPDMAGLIGAVVRSRVLHERKLNGEEIRFVRRALTLKAKTVAEYLDMTPEHYSRIEGGQTLQPTAERVFRFAAFVASLCPEPQTLFTRSDALEEAQSGEGKPSLEENLAKLPQSIHMVMRDIFQMKFQTVYDPEDTLTFTLGRYARTDEPSDCDDDDGENGDDAAWMVQKAA